MARESAWYAATVLRAADEARLSSALGFDRAALASPTHGALSTPLGTAWRKLHDGDDDAASALAEDVEGAARQRADAASVVEAAAIRALAALGRRDLDEATRLARRASRMGRTEAIFEPECLAHLVLARVRRFTGFPHLAMRIMRALWGRIPPMFRGWMAFELAMAGADPDSLGPFDARPSAIDDAARALTDLLHRTREPAAISAAAERLLEASASLPMIRDEARAVVDAIVPSRPAADPAVAAWKRGLSHETPPALHGVLTLDAHGPEDETALTYVVCDAAGVAWRFPRLGWAFLSPSVVRLAQSRRKVGRSEAIVAALALAGAAGTDEASLFEDVYGFSFVPAMHAGSLDVAVHRARRYAAAAAEIEHAGGRLRLHPTSDFVVPDPRIQKPLDDRLLCMIVDRRAATAGDLARTANISLRVAQRALADLSAEGSCQAEKRGRQVVYQVDDTTFSEPTRLRTSSS